MAQPRRDNEKRKEKLIKHHAATELFCPCAPGDQNAALKIIFRISFYSSKNSFPY